MINPLISKFPTRATAQRKCDELLDAKREENMDTQQEELDEGDNMSNVGSRVSLNFSLIEVVPKIGFADISNRISSFL